MTEKRWNVIVLSGTGIILLLIALVTIYIDPFFHYHDGQEHLEYPIKYERYQNDGMARHFEYDSIITGTSMCQNFKCSEFDSLWETKSIKLAGSGATYSESAHCIDRALSYNPNVKMVLCSLDGNRLNDDFDYLQYEGYPEYLYDNNPFNDVKYLLNKEVIVKDIAVLSYTASGQKTTTMDEYGHWSRYATFGKEAVFNSITLAEKSTETHTLSSEDIQRIQKNVKENFVKIAEKYPDTTFYLFFPPYSICYWEALYRVNQVNCQTDGQRIAVEKLLEAENIQVYDFSHMTEIVGNLDNYSDSLHYGEWINSEILQMVYKGEGRITKENYREYYDNLYELYSDYDYSEYRK